MTVESFPSGVGFDCGKSRAILIGTSRFPRDMENLPNLPAVTANVIDFERHLRDPAVVGLPPERIQRLLDEEDISLVAEKVAEASQDAEDLFLFYYTGHGLISRTGDLLLTMRNSTHAYADANCLRWSTVKEYILASPAKTKLVILDCCFSGRAFELMGPEHEVLRQDLEVRGTVVLTSSPRNEPSLAPQADRRTVFTDALLSSIEQGIDNGRLTVSIEEIFTDAKQKLRTLGAPEPQRLASAEANDIAFVLNRRSEFSQENSSFEQLVKHVEARMNRFLDTRLGLESAILQEDFVDEGRGLSPKMIAVMPPFMLFIILEVWWLLYLGRPAHSYSSTLSQSEMYPNFIGFISTTGVLILVSGLATALAIVALRSPSRSTLLSTLLLSRKSARMVARCGILNVLIVTFTALVAPFTYF
jgi:hypothetical protein